MAAVLLGVLAAVEQGVTTPSFDKQADRTRVEVVARRVDPEAAAFYFSPGVAELQPWIYHRDPNLRNQNPVWRTSSRRDVGGADAGQADVQRLFRQCAAGLDAASGLLRSGSGRRAASGKRAW